MALMLVRVVPSIKKEKYKKQQDREEVFFKEYGNDDDVKQSKEANAQRMKNMYEIIKKDSNID